MIPYSTQDISTTDGKAVLKTLNSGWLTQGPAIERFEVALAKKTGAKYAVAFNSGTAALHAAYFAAGLGADDEVLVPAITFAATANAALYLHARPVFVDVDAHGLIDPKDAAKKITKHTKIIAPVDYAGRPAPMREIIALAKKHNLIVVEDAAQSLGATYQKKRVGGIAHMTTHSFHPVKSITTAEGGAVTTNDKKFAERMKIFRTHGITKDPALLVRKNEGPWYQEMQTLGYNYRITDMQAALGENQLSRLDSFIAKRRAAARRYHALLKQVPGVTPPAPERAGETSAWHLYPVRINDASKRRKVFEALREAGIGVQVHHIPVYRHIFYEKLGYKKGLCPNAEAFYESEISIPIFARITPVQQKFVADTLKKILKSV